MAHEQRSGSRQTYLVEHYRPGRDLAQLTSSVVRLRDTVAEMQRSGDAVRCVISMIVPGDESFLCLIEAPSERVVADAYGRADIPFERISPAVCVGDRSHRKETFS
jgi:hypothetical protein